MNNIDWGAIRSLKGSQSHGFEELCAQLARTECPADAAFIRKGTPDAGVECFCVLPDGMEWGWQAKYFNSSLTTTQWQQLDGSVDTALNKHPRLVRYFVCVPRDRSDARIANQKSEMDHWNDHVAKWQGWAKERGMDVEFVFWGSHELLHLLAESSNAGRTFFFFRQRVFDEVWFRQRLDEAIHAAGPRYTPEIHIELPIVQDLERFSRSDYLSSEIGSLTSHMRRVFHGLTSVWQVHKTKLGDADLTDLTTTTNQTLRAFGAFRVDLAAVLPLEHMASLAEGGAKAVEPIQEKVWELQGVERSVREAGGSPHQVNQSYLREIVYWLDRLEAVFREAADTCKHAHSLANSQLMVVTGVAGTGKTHLLCDFAARRINNQLPAILLMGQRFLSDDDPWAQMMQQLDLGDTSVNEVVGALESAAQASDSRMLILVDAINEGNGKAIWPVHLPSLLARLQMSSWIGVVLSARSTFVKALIPGHVMKDAAIVNHEGFEGHEYDAAKAYFSYYGLEFPSAPILHPEFRNPLLLHVLCKGLKDSGETRLVREYYGATGVFTSYVNSANQRLSSLLDYDPQTNFVQQALENCSEEFLATKRSWMPRSRAQGLVNDLLPNNSFSNSLYRGLVDEGILVEDIGYSAEDVVYVAYERLAEHIAASFLVAEFMDGVDPATVFAPGGRLEYLNTDRPHEHLGLIEALCIQVPESTGFELARLAHKLMDSWLLGDAHLQSIVWRRIDAFSEDTLAVLDELISAEMLQSDPLDTFLTVSIVPDHPYNAHFLDRYLLAEAMADRDARWSIYLHDAWGTQGPVDRLIDWALDPTTPARVTDSVLELAAIAFAWMLTTPNRFIRDRATKALVSLLSGRPDATMALLDRFTDVDDVYVVERVYAVAYGVAMRCHDPSDLGLLAAEVYRRVFAAGTPPAHILLRDYARGVVERALYLGCSLEVDEGLIRPPYASTWPTIPDEEFVTRLTVEPEGATEAEKRSHWARDRICHSVLNDDFARYVIGTEFPSEWLSLKLDQEPWLTPEERRQLLVADLSEAERMAWDHWVAAMEDASLLPVIKFCFVDAKSNSLGADDDKEDEPTVDNHSQEAAEAYEQLLEALTIEHGDVLKSIVDEEKQANLRIGPRFNKRLIQRYILGRVFDLGWTTERFGSFDRFEIGFSGRDAAKSERVGKKYQWIAFHEILAHIADHYQYKERYWDEGGSAYQGPWQLSLRDIDPSLPLRSIPGGTNWGPHHYAWWTPEQYDAWAQGSDHQQWLANDAGLPDVGRLLKVANSDTGLDWLNLKGSFLWEQPHDVKETRYESIRRQLWIGATAYFLPAQAVGAFMQWAKSVDFFGRWMPEREMPLSLYFGEYGWSPAYRHLCASELGEQGWRKPTYHDGEECPEWLLPASSRYIAEHGGFDCSIDDTFSVQVSQLDLITHLGLQWSGKGGDFQDKQGVLGAFDPTVHEDGPDAILIQEDSLRQYLKDRDLALCWTVVGEKLIMGGTPGATSNGYAKLSGAYYYTGGQPKGFVDYRHYLPTQKP